MGKIFKYLMEYKKTVLLIVLLLIIQAYCDLSLPSYTSDIVDVGITQGGVSSNVPEVLSEETMKEILLFLTDEQEGLMRASYVLNEDNIYELQDVSKENLKEMESYLKTPETVLYMMTQMQEQSSSEETADSQEQTFTETSLDAQMQLSEVAAYVEAGYMTKQDFQEQMKEQLFQITELDDMVLDQCAIQFVRAEYEKCDLDTAKIQKSYLLRTGGKMIALTGLMMVVSIVTGFFSSKTGAKIGRNLRERVFKKVISFSNAEMDSFSTASLITRSTNDIQQVQMVVVILLRMVAYAPILGIGGVFKVLQTKTGLSWIIVVAVVAILLLVGILMVVAMPKFKAMQNLVDRLNLISREILTGIPVIRAFSREVHEKDRFEEANQNLYKTQLFTNRVMSVMMPVMMLIMNIITVMIVWFGAKGVDLGTMMVGDMMAFITYTMQIVMAFLMLTAISIMLPRAGVAANRIEEVIASESIIKDKKETKDELLANEKGVVSFEDVSFKFQGADDNTLSNITFTAKPGETTAIIGSTGCGKSTLVNLIPRFYDVTEGSVKIDGVDVRDLSQQKLREMLGYVPQKGVLFSGTIASNLKFGGEQITDEDMEQAAAIAQATEFIDGKPDRYETPISQGGTNVSGGQKQRLSIARALARHPKILIFDDSFSALDYKTDVILRKALHEQTADATVIIVAQRISTILHADNIIVLEDGKIVGQGTHETLLRECESYQEIAKSQLSEKELEGLL